MRMMHSVTRQSNSDIVQTTETVEMFLARGGTITKCPTRNAANESVYTPTVVVDGYELPMTTTPGNEYVPNFVRDLDTYDTAQQKYLSVEDDGSAPMLRDYVKREVSSTVAWHSRNVSRSAREGADYMEND